MITKTIQDVLDILVDKQGSYIDPAEHVSDSIKVMERHLNNGADLLLYIDDFICGLSSSTNGDWEGVLEECVNILQALKLDKGLDKK